MLARLHVLRPHTKLLTNTQQEGTIVVPGTPLPQKRHRSSFRSGKIRNYDPSAKDKKKFKVIAGVLAPRSALKGDISLNVTFYMPRPKTHRRTGKYSKLLKKDAPLWHSIKPDIDNLVKFVMDALQGILWEDDCKIVSLEARKLYSEKPRTEIEFWTINE